MQRGTVGSFRNHIRYFHLRRESWKVRFPQCQSMTISAKEGHAVTLMSISAAGQEPAAQFESQSFQGSCSPSICGPLKTSGVEVCDSLFHRRYFMLPVGRVPEVVVLATCLQMRTEGADEVELIIVEAA